MSYVDELILEIVDITRRVGALERIEIPPSSAIVPVYSGTPTAGAIAYWTGAGTVAAGGAVTYSNGNLTIAGTATSGNALSITRNLTAASTDSPVVSILQDHPSDDQPALQVQQDSSQIAVKVIGDATSADINLKVAGVQVEGYLGQYTSGITQLAINRRVTGAFSDTGKAAASVNLNSASGDASVAIYTSPANNTAPVLAGYFDKNQKFGVGTIPTKHLHVKGDTATSELAFEVTSFSTKAFFALLKSGSNAYGQLSVNRDIAGAYSNAGVAAANINLFSGNGDGNIGLYTSPTNATDPLLGLFVDKNQNVAIGGSTTPQGKMHAHDGTGGFLFVSKTGIVGSNVVIIPDGTGDITKRVSVTGIADDGTTSYGISTTIAVSGTLTVGNVGVSTIQFAVSAGGELSVIRALGSSTWATSILVVWK